MNYEEKYKEALERAKSFQEKYGGDYAGYIFPELAESDDERIRRKMIEHFKAKTKETWCNMPVKDIIAYLEKQKDINCLACDQHLKGYLAGRKVTEEEKQKEQKPADLSEMMVHKEPYIAPVPTPMVADEQKPVKPSGKLSRQDYLYQLLIDQLITYSDYEYLIEHKPAELKEDTQLLAGDYAISHYEQGKTYSSIEVHKMLADAFIAGKSYQKPAEWSAPKINGEPIPTENHSVDIPLAEWSEEDQKSLNRAINICISDFGEESETARFLKSLPGRFNLQPKTEWSEEDEKMLERAIHIIVEYSDIDKEESEIVQNWLKSLRPRPHWEPSEQEKGALRTAIHVLTDERNFPKAAAHLQNILNAFEGEESRKDWKPSDEQMKALSWLVEYVAPSEEYIILIKKLYEQLKKL